MKPNPGYLTTRTHWQTALCQFELSVENSVAFAGKWTIIEDWTSNSFITMQMSGVLSHTVRGTTGGQYFLI